MAVSVFFPVLHRNLQAQIYFQLVMVAGLPTSGKTHRAKQLTAYFESRLQHSKDPNLKRPTIRHVHLISEHSLHLPRSAFGDRNTEKTSRAALYSACKRALGRDSVVILDAGNYIKGYRYQLHCEAKAVGVRSCVVHVGIAQDKARSLNQARVDKARRGESKAGGEGQEDPYESEVWEELVMRFEEPNPMARWDRPLWAVVWDDADLSIGGHGGIGQSVWEEVVCGVGKNGQFLGEVKMNQATVLTPAAVPNHLHDLDRITQSILAQVQAQIQQNDGLPGGSVRIALPQTAFPGEPTVDQIEADPIVGLPATSSPSFAHLQRLRRQFIALHRQQMGGQGMGGIGSGGAGFRTSRIASLFVDWLNDAFGI
ncbi:hypothetical protein FH972_021889 [Carpinus fangiana]|uniref:Uncharacterized protein n=1 Tax=Carpinus fangiana TaxID=176857 RepID=A0A5N6KR76_9ROSI|nr:hypothetical protein FH972_021889 [Carpinus fangiana]